MEKWLCCHKEFKLSCLFGRRTADVRTVGYVECFVLSKEDVVSAVRDYPEAQVRHAKFKETPDLSY